MSYDASYHFGLLGRIAEMERRYPSMRQSQRFESPNGGDLMGVGGMPGANGFTEQWNGMGPSGNIGVAPPSATGPMGPIGNRGVGGSFEDIYARTATAPAPQTGLMGGGNPGNYGFDPSPPSGGLMGRPDGSPGNYGFGPSASAGLMGPNGNPGNYGAEPLPPTGVGRGLMGNGPGNTGFDPGRAPGSMGAVGNRGVEPAPTSPGNLGPVGNRGFAPAAPSPGDMGARGNYAIALDNPAATGSLRADLEANWDRLAARGAPGPQRRVTGR